MNQLRQNIDIVIEHFYIFFVLAAPLDILPDIINPVFQRVDIPKQALQPAPAFPVRRDFHQFVEFTAKLIEQRIRILQGRVLIDHVKCDITYCQLVDTFIHLFLEVQIVIIRYRHVAHDRIIGITVIQERKNQIHRYRQQRNHRYQHQCKHFML